MMNWVMMMVIIIAVIIVGVIIEGVLGNHGERLATSSPAEFAAVPPLAKAWRGKCSSKSSIWVSGFRV